MKTFPALLFAALVGGATIAHAIAANVCSQSNGIKHCERTEANYTATTDSDKQGQWTHARLFFPDIRGNAAEAVALMAVMGVLLARNNATDAERREAFTKLLQKMNNGDTTSVPMGNFDLVVERSEAGSFRFEARKRRR